MCGEKIILKMQQQVDQGSPPHVRGKVHIAEVRRVARRITPACAGKSSTWSPIFGRQWDHPRMCGEKGEAVQEFAVAVGITPACAGKRSPPLSAALAVQDHPRMCGEKFRSAGRAGRDRGSPPHVRGKVR